MSEPKKESMRGKAPKAGKGTGRKASPIKTAVVSVRLPTTTIKIYSIDSAWLFDAVTKKLEAKTGLNYAQPYDPSYAPNLEAEHNAALRNELMQLLIGDEGVVSPERSRIIEILQELGIL